MYVLEIGKYPKQNNLAVKSARPIGSSISCMVTSRDEHDDKNDTQGFRNESKSNLDVIQVTALLENIDIYMPILYLLINLEQRIHVELGNNYTFY